MTLVVRWCMAGALRVDYETTVGTQDGPFFMGSKHTRQLTARKKKKDVAISYGNEEPAARSLDGPQNDDGDDSGRQIEITGGLAQSMYLLLSVVPLDLLDLRATRFALWGNNDARCARSSGSSTRVLPSKAVSSRACKCPLPPRRSVRPLVASLAVSMCSQPARPLSTAWHALELIPFLLLGVFGGVYGAFFSKLNHRWSHDVRNKTWLKDHPIAEVLLVRSSRHIPNAPRTDLISRDHGDHDGPELRKWLYAHGWHGACLQPFLHVPPRLAKYARGTLRARPRQTYVPSHAHDCGGDGRKSCAHRRDLRPKTSRGNLYPQSGRCAAGSPRVGKVHPCSRLAGASCGSALSSCSCPSAVAASRSSASSPRSPSVEPSRGAMSRARPSSPLPQGSNASCFAVAAPSAALAGSTPAVSLVGGRYGLHDRRHSPWLVCINNCRFGSISIRNHAGKLGAHGCQRFSWPLHPNGRTDKSKAFKASRESRCVAWS
jgi:hypothetical protein